MTELERQKNVEVIVKSEYLAQQSDESDEQYVFSYTITITNKSNEILTLLTRHWVITDADGDQKTVSGEGVIGQQPQIKPNTSFTYTSGCALKTPLGTMEGHYQFINRQQKPYIVDINPFRLAKPNILH